ncbi:MAG: TetR family transcriptional regulator [Microthrixaceae bacterium]
MTSTRDRLLDVAEQRFARSGIAAVTTREIVEAAGQRNTSAVSYHFGSREGLLAAILRRRGGPIDIERGRRRASLGDASHRDLIACLVVPYSAMLDDGGGRAYLRIVDQLRGRFTAWRIESDVESTAQLAAILDEIERGIDAPAALRRERIVALIMLMTSSIADRARRIDDGETPELDHDDYLANLVDMCTAVLQA